MKGLEDKVTSHDSLSLPGGSERDQTGDLLTDRNIAVLVPLPYFLLIHYFH